MNGWMNKGPWGGCRWNRGKGWLHGRGCEGFCLGSRWGGHCRWKAEREHSHGSGSLAGWLTGGWEGGTWTVLHGPSPSPPQCPESLRPPTSVLPSNSASPSRGSLWMPDVFLFVPDWTVGSVNYHLSVPSQCLVLWEAHCRCSPNLLNKWFFTKWKFHFHLTQHHCYH